MAGAGDAHIGGLIPVVRPLLTSELTGNVIPWHAGYSSGLGSARPGLSQKGGLPARPSAFRATLSRAAKSADPGPLVAARPRGRQLARLASKTVMDDNVYCNVR